MAHKNLQHKNVFKAKYERIVRGKNHFCARKDPEKIICSHFLSAVMGHKTTGVAGLRPFLLCGLPYLIISSISIFELIFLSVQFLQVSPD